MRHIYWRWPNVIRVEKSHDLDATLKNRPAGLWFGLLGNIGEQGLKVYLPSNWIWQVHFSQTRLTMIENFNVTSFKASFLFEKKWPTFMSEIFRHLQNPIACCVRREPGLTRWSPYTSRSGGKNNDWLTDAESWGSTQRPLTHISPLRWTAKRGGKYWGLGPRETK